MRETRERRESGERWSMPNRIIAGSHYGDSSNKDKHGSYGERIVFVR